MKRHAYLIMAHDNLYTLEKILQLLDCEKNDIYIHCDKKMGDIDAFANKIHESIGTKVEFISKRTDIRWGGYTQTSVELDLLNAAVPGEYSYYHFISGTSIPIKPQKEIHRFFDEEAGGRLFFHINSSTAPVIQERVKAYYPLVSLKCFRKHKWLKAISLVMGKIQIALGVNRLRKSEFKAIYNGWSYFSIPHDFAVYCCSKQAVVEKTFRHTLASDEAWIHTLAVHSDFKDRTYGLNGKNAPIDASKHFQDWKRGKPYTFTKEDFDILMADNGAFWARKFDDKKDREIIDMIYQQVRSS